MKSRSTSQEEYVRRINQVLDYIDARLTDRLTLDSLAEVSCFSRFHFHRIFRALVGETLNQYIQRVRLEKAASMLLVNPKKNVTDIALDCGFSSSASFARVFKTMFQMTASQYRTKHQADDSKIDQTNRKICLTIDKNRKDRKQSSFYIDRETHTLRWRIPMEQNEVQVEVKTMPEFNVAYVRHIGPYKGNVALFEGLFEKLMRWAGPRGLLRFPETQVICVYHDDPSITDESKLRISACITVPTETKAEGEIGRMTIPGGAYAKARFELKSDEFEGAWNALCGKWLPTSGYQPADGVCYEICRNDYKEHPEQKHIVDICIPIKPL